MKKFFFFIPFIAALFAFSGAASAQAVGQIAPADVITSVEQGKASTTNSFLLRGTGEDDKKFEDEAIQIDIPANVAATAAHNQKGSA